MIQEIKRRCRIVRQYHRLRQAGSREADAAQQTATQFACGVASVRRYARAFAQGGMAGLKPIPRVRKLFCVSAHSNRYKEYHPI